MTAKPPAPAARLVRVFVVLSMLLAASALSDSAGGEAEEAHEGVLFSDDFSGETLDPGKWTVTRLNDFETESAAIAGGRLRMAASSVGTDDRTVKFHGVRTAQPVVGLSAPVEVDFELDWRDQANGCYMTAGAYICPTVSDNPRDEDTWLRVQYIGVPPGRNARCLISLRARGRERRLLTEDWPEKREGRVIGRQALRILLDGPRLRVTENGETILDVDDVDLGAEQAYLYLQHSTHSNYRLREVFFDDVVVRRAAPTDEAE